MASHPRQVVTIAAWSALPAVALALVLLWTGPYGPRVQWTGTLFMGLALAVGLSVLYDRVTRPLQTASNLLAALREGDFSLRARASDPDDDLGLLYIEATAWPRCSAASGLAPSKRWPSCVRSWRRSMRRCSPSMPKGACC